MKSQPPAPPSSHQPLPWALGALPGIRREIGRRSRAFFLDFDGTLVPIATRPDLVELDQPTRDALGRLLRTHVVCFVSGRGLEDLRRVVGLESAYYAANHGHQIVGPVGSGVALEVGAEHRAQLRAVAEELEGRLGSIDGVMVENKELSLAVHYRLAAEDAQTSVERIVKEVACRSASLRLREGKMVYDLLPPGTWDKGGATVWLLERLGWGRDRGCPICLGDDTTDEDMFAAINGWGVSVVVGGQDRVTRARYWLHDGAEARMFLAALAE